jgi:hypothetical protein
MMLRSDMYVTAINSRIRKNQIGRPTNPYVYQIWNKLKRGLTQDQIAISGTSLKKKRLAFGKTFHTLTAFPPKRSLNET